MSTELANPNKDCCTIPPVQVEAGSYEEKGSYKAYGGYDRVYFTGPTDTGKVIITLYDAFGFSSQGAQGADILAEQADALIVIPDVFKGDQLTESDFAGDEASKARVQKWFGSTGNFINHFEGIYALSAALKTDGYTKVGLIGFCWGGKVVTLAATDATKVDAVVSIHPGRVDPADADRLVVPIAFFPSNGEPKDDCDKFWERLQARPFASKCEYKYYATVHHGWAGARANLKDEENVKEFKDVYTRSGAFFKSVLA